MIRTPTSRLQLRFERERRGVAKQEASVSETAGRLELTIVVAAARNGVIGRDGDMPWRMPSSLKRFRALTMGRPMIMGRKTFEAIGRVLDGRDTVVVSRNAKFHVDGVYHAPDFPAAVGLAASLARARGVAEIVVAGGGEIYRAALPFAARVCLDVIDVVLEGDTTFPGLDLALWREVGREPLPPAEGDMYPATAVVYERIGRPAHIEAPWQPQLLARRP